VVDYYANVSGSAVLVVSTYNYSPSPTAYEWTSLTGELYPSGVGEFKVVLPYPPYAGKEASITLATNYGPRCVLEWYVMKVVKTANEELDRRIGGIPHPSTIIVEGEHGVGKTVFAGQLAYGFLQNDMKVVFVTTEALSYDLVVKLRGVKVDLVEAFLEGRFRVVPVNV